MSFDPNPWNAAPGELFGDDRLFDDDDERCDECEELLDDCECTEPTDEECPDCDGTGLTPEGFDCPECDGEGRIEI
jgi:hypothetical protein